MKKKLLLVIFCLLLLAPIAYLVDYWNLLPQPYYSAPHFGIKTIASPIDYNNNGVDDYTDIMLGARQDALNRPRYDGSYHAGGYPPDQVGVCTDVIWRAFKHAGYCLKDMVNKDIQANKELYPYVKGQADGNIDFRRVPNLKVYFSRKAVSLTLDPKQIDQWQPGDIVTFGSKHIAIVSDRRNRQGIPYIIHNGGQPRREEDALTRHSISGHFRFDASQMPPADLIPWSTTSATTGECSTPAAALSDNPVR